MRKPNELLISAELIEEFLADGNVTGRALVAPGIPKGAKVIGAGYDERTHQVVLEFDQPVPELLFHTQAAAYARS